METARESAPHQEPALSQPLYAFLSSASIFLFFSLSYPISIPFLLNVQVSLNVIYLQLSSLPTSPIAVTFPATSVYPSNPA